MTPDVHTFTLLLRGLAANAHLPSSLGRALALYNSIRTPKSGVAPTIIHVNATLSVAARSGDMDSMWHILSELPEKGSHAPDSATFTTMINAMRVKAMTGPDDEEPIDAAMRKESIIVEGRKLWAAVVARWRSGDVRIDEGLVAAMGRLLLCGMRPHDWDDVLSLLEQTMQKISRGQTIILPVGSFTSACHKDIYDFISMPAVDAAVIQHIEDMFLEKRHLINVVYHIRGLFVHRILLSTLKKRWNVQYGLNPTRDPIAVPYQVRL